MILNPWVFIPLAIARGSVTFGLLLHSLRPSLDDIHAYVLGKSHIDLNLPDLPIAPLRNKSLSQARAQRLCPGEATVAVGLALARSSLVAGVLGTPFTSSDHVMIRADLTGAAGFDAWIQRRNSFSGSQVNLCGRQLKPPASRAGDRHMITCDNDAVRTSHCWRHINGADAT